jgi:hypothetical protein
LVRDAHRLGPQYLACSVRKAKHTHVGYMIKLSRLCSLDLPLAPVVTRGGHLVEQTPKQKLDHRPPASTASTNADGAKNNNIDDQAPDQEAGSDNDSESDADEP